MFEFPFAIEGDKVGSTSTVCGQGVVCCVAGVGCVQELSRSCLD